MKDSGGYLDGRKRESVYILLYTICPTEFTTKFTMALLTDSNMSILYNTNERLDNSTLRADCMNYHTQVIVNPTLNK